MQHWLFSRNNKISVEVIVKYLTFFLDYFDYFFNFSFVKNLFCTISASDNERHDETYIRRRCSIDAPVLIVIVCRRPVRGRFLDAHNDASRGKGQIHGIRSRCRRRSILIVGYDALIQARFRLNGLSPITTGGKHRRFHVFFQLHSTGQKLQWGSRVYVILRRFLFAFQPTCFLQKMETFLTPRYWKDTKKSRSYYALKYFFIFHSFNHSINFLDIRSINQAKQLFDQSKN